MLKWKRPQWRHQRTHCGRYRVEKIAFRCGYGTWRYRTDRWFAYRSDYDEPLSFDGFVYRSEARAYCEADERETN